ncbi:MAG: hypothetical protein PHO89_04835 [Methylacidiphilaceae bacterium]|nr:hypothetical protein [Candidatus Methylacidiphilaceae bacterium]
MQLGRLLKLDFGEAPLERVFGSLDAERRSVNRRLQQGVKPDEFPALHSYSLALERATEVLRAFSSQWPVAADQPSGLAPLAAPLASSVAPREADPPKEILSVLVKTGYLALTHGLVGHAREIFDGLTAIRPKSPIPLIGQALLLVESGNGSQGAALLREKAIGLEPDCDDLVRAHLGLVLRLIGSNQEAWNVLEQVVTAGRDPEAVSFARGLLQEPSPGAIPSVPLSSPSRAQEEQEGSLGEPKADRST